MEIQKVLVLSTAHLPLKEFQDLMYDKYKPYRFVDHEYGAILILSVGFAYLFNKDDIVDVIVEYALDNGISYINFDEGGEVYKEFETFDW